MSHAAIALVAFVVQVVVPFAGKETPSTADARQGSRQSSSAGSSGPATDPRQAARNEEGWPRVHIRDPLIATVVRRALDEGNRFLLQPRCRTVLTEFRDPSGRPLDDKLAALGVDIHRYLRLVLFEDAGGSPLCDGRTAFTSRGSRVVFVCGSLLKTWRENGDVAFLIIHEVLHTLGLGENPPASADITDKVRSLCGR